VVDDEGEARRAIKALQEKYAGHGVPSAAPKATLDHYGKGMTVIRIDPAGTPLTWDNSKLRLRGRDTTSEEE
jgi:hypothetical protein